MNDIRRVLSYNDVLLCPRNSELEHLSDANIRCCYDGYEALPLINAPMDKVCTPELLTLLDYNDCFTTIHRWFDSVEDQIKFFESCDVDPIRCFIAVGIVDKWKSWIDRLIEYQKENAGENYFNFLVDVANGDTRSAIDTVSYIKSKSGDDTMIMAGNVATKSAFRRLQDVGANFIRVGIGGGSICSTRLNTGFGIPTLTSVMDCALVKNGAYLVADGGIESSGDICKAMAAGADMVMLGKMLAATSLSNGEKLDSNFSPTYICQRSGLDYIEPIIPSMYKWVRYSGMASKEANEKLKSKKSVVSIEGVSGLIPYTGETQEVVNNIIGNLQSAVAYYAGCTNWDDFRRSVKFLEISQQGWEESKTRVNI